MMKPFSFHRSKKIIRSFYELQAHYMQLHDQLEILKHPERGSTTIEGKVVPLSDLDERQLLALHLAVRRDLELLGGKIQDLGTKIRDDNTGAIEETTKQHVPERDPVRRARGRRARREARENLIRSSGGSHEWK